jgi:hypothetical protein
MDTLLRLPEVMKRTGLGRTSVYHFMAKGKFPRGQPVDRRPDRKRPGPARDEPIDGAARGQLRPPIPHSPDLLATERDIRANMPGAELASAIHAAQSALEGERFRRFTHEPNCPS